MNPTVFTALRARSETIEQRWQELLEEQTSRLPLVRPLGLAFWIPKAVQRVLGYLEHADPVQAVGSLSDHGCDCGNNPYLAFYTAGEQALVETLDQVLSAYPGVARADEQRPRVYCALSRLALRDIEQFCRVCAISTTCSDRQARRQAIDALTRADQPSTVSK